MKPVVHAVAGAIAMLTILSFWISTLISELFLCHAAIVAVKQAILYGMLLLIPALATTGGSGILLASGHSELLVKNKQMRMRIIAANGLLIMMPCAFFLFHKATVGEFDSVFYLVQTVELLVGAIQLSLLGLNFRDGLKLAGRLRFAKP